MPDTVLNPIEPDRRDLAAAVDLRRVLQLRRDGYSVEQIGDKMRMSPLRVLTLVGDALKELNGSTREYAEQIRELELQRLDVATKAVMPQVDAGEPDAIASLIRIQNRRAKFLGLDAPVEQRNEVKITLDFMTPDRAAYLQGRAAPADVIEHAPQPFKPTPVEREVNTLIEAARERGTDPS